MSVLSQTLKYSFLVAIISGCATSDSDLKVGGEDFTKADIAQSNNSIKNNSNIKLSKVNFDKKHDTAGIVTLSLNDMPAFELKQTTPTEYVLFIPGATAASDTKEPQIALSGASGIRTVRVTEDKSDVLVRMFVDSDISLAARIEGKNIVVSATSMAAALNSEARGQLADNKKADKKSDKKGDIPSADGSKIYTGKLISLDLQDTSIDNALKIIAEVSRLNIIASEEVKGKVTLRLVDVPWDQALDVILKTNGLDQVAEGNVVRIAPVRKLREEREALIESKKAAQSLEETQVVYIRISYARASELVEQVQSVLTERGSVVVDERTNQLIIKDVQEGLKKSYYLVAKLDLRTPQILLETQIVEGARSFSRDFGVKWNAAKRSSSGNTIFGDPNTFAGTTKVIDSGSRNEDRLTEDVSATAGILGFGSGGLGFGAIWSMGDWNILNALEAFEQEGKAKIISRPQIATVNNKPAEIKSVQTIRVRNTSNSGVTVSTGANSAAAGNNATFESVEVGITLKVTPQASPDYYVLLDIDAKSSTLAPDSVTSTLNATPNTIDRSATSTVLVESGTTFALGGIYKTDTTDTVSGVPFFKDIPVLGHMFRGTGVISNDEELVFFITPHVVEGSFDEDAMRIMK